MVYNFLRETAICKPQVGSFRVGEWLLFFKNRKWSNKKTDRGKIKNLFLTDNYFL
jgi:hypothetical protein